MIEFKVYGYYFIIATHENVKKEKKKRRLILKLPIMEDDKN